MLVVDAGCCRLSAFGYQLSVKKRPNLVLPRPPKLYAQEGLSLAEASREGGLFSTLNPITKTKSCQATVLSHAT